jgi:hypothetical protein
MGNSSPKSASSEPSSITKPEKKQSFSRIPLTITLSGIETRISLVLSANDLTMLELQSILAEKLKSPKSLQMKLYQDETHYLVKEAISDSTRLNHIKKDFILQFEDPSKAAKIVSVSFYIWDNITEVISARTYNFIPLNYIISSYHLCSDDTRIFHHTDHMLENPMETTLSIRDIYGDNQDDALFIVYYPSKKDIIKISIKEGNDINFLDSDKHTRISDLNNLYNKTYNKTAVLCDTSTNKRLNETIVLGKLLSGNHNTLSLIAYKFDDYYKSKVDLPKPNPLEMEDVETHFLEMPD